jgi:hypothetical protein
VSEDTRRLTSPRFFVTDDTGKGVTSSPWKMYRLANSHMSEDTYVFAADTPTPREWSAAR